jgi:hypothetical protein
MVCVKTRQYNNDLSRWRARTHFVDEIQVVREEHQGHETPVNLLEYAFGHCRIGWLWLHLRNRLWLCHRCSLEISHGGYS